MEIDLDLDFRFRFSKLILLKYLRDDFSREKWWKKKSKK